MVMTTTQSLESKLCDFTYRPEKGDSTYVISCIDFIGLLRPLVQLYAREAEKIGKMSYMSDSWRKMALLFRTMENTLPEYPGLLHSMVRRELEHKVYASLGVQEINSILGKPKTNLLDVFPGANFIDVERKLLKN